MSKVISNVDYDETLSLTELKTGFWLYDTTRGMNLSMRAKSKDEALFETIKYYQRRLLDVEAELKSLSQTVNDFIENVSVEDSIDIPETEGAWDE